MQTFKDGKMRLKGIVKVLIFSTGLVAVACAYQNEEDLFGEQNCTPGAITFSMDIQPILQTKCALPGCHNSSNPSIPDWTVFSNVQNKATLIKIRTANGTMPPSNTGVQLTTTEITEIGCWVDDGAPNN